jgi:GntR family transcriptional regulator
MANKTDEIAEDLRERVRRGDLQPGTKLPSIDDLAREYDCNRNTATRALNQLKSEGLLEYRAGRGSGDGGGGTYVRERPTQRVIRSRSIERDHLGYYSGPEVQHWRAVPFPDGEKKRVITAPVPADVAEILGVQAGEQLTVRKRIVGDPDRPEYRQLADSWISPWIVEELPILTGDTGLGGMYDRIEEWAEKPLNWTEEVTAAAPSPEEAEVLTLPPGVPLLRVLRVAALGRGKRARVVEVQDIRMSSELFAVRYPIERRGAARWPVEPASSDYYTSP